jgi:peptidoglycan glycosyltransferase
MSDSTDMNRPIRRLGVALIVMFTLLFVQLNYIQVWRADELNNRPENARKILRTFARPRGTIATADGVVLARSNKTDDQFEYQREYPEGDLFGHITGYLNFQFGAAGVEQTYNDELSGEIAQLEFQSVSDVFVDRNKVGNVGLTIRKDVQQVAREALGDRKGSVVALDPQSGEILALWSFPSYDPDPLAAHGESAEEVKKVLDADPNKPLLARSYRERFFPGSTFKVVTGSIGLQSGTVTNTDPVYPQEPSFTPRQTRTPLRNFGGDTCGGPLPEILRVSCNTSFARMAIELGPDTMVRGAEDFGFNEKPPIDLPFPAASNFPAVEKFKDNEPLLAFSAIGQGDVSATPLQMALVASAIANDGEIMEPHLLADVTDDKGTVVKSYEPEVWKTATSPQTAQTMRENMKLVVAEGTAQALDIPGMEVGAKTGTAQLGTDPPQSHTWCIAWAGPPGDPQVAVAVVVERQSGASEATGGRIAAPIARAVIDKVLEVRKAGG